MATLYFDAESGLLVRQLRYADSPVGRMPTQIDYSDYREVSGVKIPFRWTVTWLDANGQQSAVVDSVQAGSNGPTVTAGGQPGLRPADLVEVK